MNQELQEKVFTWVQGAAEKIGDWTSKEVPLFIHEFLLWRFWENVIGIVQFFGCCIIGLLMVITIFKFLVKPLWKEGGDAQFGSIVIALVVTGIVGPLFFTQFPTDNIKNCLQIKIAPKVYLIEEAIKLAK